MQTNATGDGLLPMKRRSAAFAGLESMPVNTATSMSLKLICINDQNEMA